MAVLVVVVHALEVAILVVAAVVVSVVDVLRRALPAALRLEDGVDPGGVVVAFRPGPGPVQHALCLVEFRLAACCMRSLSSAVLGGTS